VAPIVRFELFRQKRIINPIKPVAAGEAILAMDLASGHGLDSKKKTADGAKESPSRSTA
jgi:hypothetical protein